MQVFDPNLFSFIFLDRKKQMKKIGMFLFSAKLKSASPTSKSVIFFLLQESVF
jgi:hypothetical protein